MTRNLPVGKMELNYDECKDLSLVLYAVSHSRAEISIKRKAMAYITRLSNFIIRTDREKMKTARASFNAEKDEQKKSVGGEKNE